MTVHMIPSNVSGKLINAMRLAGYIPHVTGRSGEQKKDELRDLNPSSSATYMT